MSTDLETFLRTAADGPVPDLDVAELRRRGTRRRRLQQVVAGGSLAVVAAVAIVAFPPLGDTPPSPVIGASPQPSSPAPPDASTSDPSPDLEVVAGTVPSGCAIHFTEQGELRAVAMLDEVAAEVLCADEAQPEDVRDLGVLYSEIGRAPGDVSDDGFRALGLVDDEVDAVVLHLDDGQTLRASTEVVTTPGDVDVRAFVVDVPSWEWRVIRLETLDADGEVRDEVGREELGRLGWADVAAEPPTTDAAPSTGRPFGDVPLELPDEVPPLGTWRPAGSPLDLSPLSLEDTADSWYRNADSDDPDAPYGVGADGVARRLGSEDDLDALCVFLTAQVEDANSAVDTSGEDPSVVAETVVHLVLRQEQVIGGDGLTAVVADACGLSDRFED